MIIYTASDQCYADSVLAHIDPMKAYFKHRLYRHNCVKLNSENGLLYVKDLRIIRNIPLSNMIIIDNSVLSFAFHLSNGIPILPFYSNKEDSEMNFLKNYLTKLSKYNNITEQNGNTFKLKSVLEQATNISEEENYEYEDSSKSATNLKVKPSDSKQSLGFGSLNAKREKTDKNLMRSKKMENLEVLNEDKGGKPARRKSKIQSVIFETLTQIKKGNK